MSWFKLNEVNSAAIPSANDSNEIISSPSCIGTQVSNADLKNQIVENNAPEKKMPANNHNKNNDSSCSLKIGHVSKTLMKLNEINSADDVSRESFPCEDGISWQNLLQLPAIQLMTSYFKKTCDNCRQTMRAVLSSQQRCNHCGSNKIAEFTSKDMCSQTDQQVSLKAYEAYVRNKTKSIPVTFNSFKYIGKVNISRRDGTLKTYGGAFATGDGRSGLSMGGRPMPSSLKRKRGRPPSAGPSKKIKTECSVSSKASFYDGKLRYVCYRHQAGDF